MQVNQSFIQFSSELNMQKKTNPYDGHIIWNLIRSELLISASDKWFTV